MSSNVISLMVIDWPCIEHALELAAYRTSVIELLLTCRESTDNRYICRTHVFVVLDSSQRLRRFLTALTWSLKQMANRSWCRGQLPECVHVFPSLDGINGVPKQLTQVIPSC